MSGEFRVATAENDAKGIELIKNELPDLIVLDIGLPDMDGRKLCKHLRKHGFKKPILMLTANRCRSGPRFQCRRQRLRRQALRVCGAAGARPRTLATVRAH
jgi:CheY-like chemotaxis protein